MIIEYPNPILTTKINKYYFDRELYQILRETAKKYGGIGISANQIGVSNRVCLSVNKIYVNPIIIREVGTITSEEECLSLPRKRVSVPRAEFVVVEYFDENEKPRVEQLSGYHAIVLQHEIDHLNGKVIADYEVHSVSRK